MSSDYMFWGWIVIGLAWAGLTVFGIYLNHRLSDDERDWDD